MLEFEPRLSEMPKQRVLNLLREQAESPGWIRQGSRNLFRTGHLWEYRYTDNPMSSEAPQFYEEYWAQYRRGELINSHFLAMIPSGRDGVWYNADLLTIYGVNTATGIIRVSQVEAPYKDPANLDQSRLQTYNQYGIDKLDEETQWRRLEEVLRSG